MTAPPPAPPGLRSSTEPLSAVYDVALLDLDGVVYLGGTAVPGAAAALKQGRDGRPAARLRHQQRLPDAGRDRRPADRARRPRRPARRGHLRAGSGAAAGRTAGAGNSRAGHRRGRAARRDQGTGPAPGHRGGGPARCRGAGILARHQLRQPGRGRARGAGRRAVRRVQRGPHLPTPRGRQPGNGALVQVIATATGIRPLVAGKPEPPLYAESVQRTGARRPIVVGDRLDTDIEGARRVGADSLLVLTGVSPRRPAAGAAGAAPVVPGGRPDRAARAASRGDRGRRRVRLPWLDGAAGGRWPRLELTGAGDRLDGLRALAAAAWSAGPITAQAAGQAVRRLDGLAAA